MQDRQFFRRVGSCEYVYQKYGVSLKPATLAKLASVGGGPRFRHIGRWPVYSRADLDEWIESRASGLKASTSDRGHDAPLPESVEG